MGAQQRRLGGAERARFCANAPFRADATRTTAGSARTTIFTDASGHSRALHHQL